MDEVETAGGGAADQFVGHDNAVAHGIGAVEVVELAGPEGPLTASRFQAILERLLSSSKLRARKLFARRGCVALMMGKQAYWRQ